jgi:DNA-binding PadR family transcriptional regulator
MASSLPRIELHILVALARSGGEAPAVEIHEDIERVSGHDTSIAGLYSALERLEGRGLARATWSDPRPERGGRARRQFRLTAAGREYVRREHALATRLWGGVAVAPGSRRARS